MSRNVSVPAASPEQSLWQFSTARKPATQTAWHITARAHRDSILKNGITGHNRYMRLQTPSVFVLSDLRFKYNVAADVSMFGHPDPGMIFDVWQVNLAGRKVKPDIVGELYSHTRNSWIVAGGFFPDSIQLAETFAFDQQEMLTLGRIYRTGMELVTVRENRRRNPHAYTLMDQVRDVMAKRTCGVDAATAGVCAR